jgi:hypothetical protein
MTDAPKFAADLLAAMPAGYFDSNPPAQWLLGIAACAASPAFTLPNHAKPEFIATEVAGMYFRVAINSYLHDCKRAASLFQEKAGREVLEAAVTKIFPAHFPEPEKAAA